MYFIYFNHTQKDLTHLTHFYPIVHWCRKKSTSPTRALQLASGWRGEGGHRLGIGGPPALHPVLCLPLQAVVCDPGPRQTLHQGDQGAGGDGGFNSSLFPNHQGKEGAGAGKVEEPPSVSLPPGTGGRQSLAKEAAARSSHQRPSHTALPGMQWRRLWWPLPQSQHCWRTSSGMIAAEDT